MRGDIELRVLPNDALMTCGLTRRRRGELSKAREALLRLAGASDGRRTAA